MEFPDFPVAGAQGFEDGVLSPDPAALVVVEKFEFGFRWWMGRGHVWYLRVKRAGLQTSPLIQSLNCQTR